MKISREVRPEILDGLAQDSPAARASRRDLRIINGFLGSTAWFRRILHEQRRPGESVLEIGAGDGRLAGQLNLEPANVAGLDLCGRPANWPTRSRWFKTDIIDFEGWANYPIVIGNLFFHHFDQARLAELGARISRHARLIIASEPLRVRHTLSLFALLCRLIRAHAVTRYDGRVSIAAGFRHEELPCLLQLDLAVWSWEVGETWRGTSNLIARRRL